MSVMLKTTNPEAAGELEQQDRRRPYQGQIVIFHPRPGEGRAGRATSVGTVLYVEDDDSVDLLIMYDADDFIMRRKIPRKTDQNNINCWSFNEHDENYYHPLMVATPSIGTAMRVEIDELRKQVDHLSGVVRKLDAAMAKKR